MMRLMRESRMQRREAQSGESVRQLAARGGVATRSKVSLITTVDDEAVEVFVFGQHAPDDTVTRHVL